MATISRRVASGPVGKSSALSYSVATDRQSTGRLEGNALIAIRSGDVAALETTVKKGLELSSPFHGRDQFCALHWAALHGSVEVSVSCTVLSSLPFIVLV